MSGRPSDEIEPVAEEPRRRRIDAGALHVGALEYGPPDARPVVMTHGLADSAWSLDRLARSLSDRYRVISLDLRGHGMSDWGAYTLPHFVGDLVGVCEALELDRPLMLGHSLGGQAVAQFCGLYPEIPCAAVLIEALGPPPRSDERENPEAYERAWTRRRADMVRRPARHRPLADLGAAVERFAIAHPRLDPSTARFIVEKNTKELADESRTWRHDPETRDWLAGHDHDRAEQRWQGVTCPVQVVLGAEAWETFWSRMDLFADDLVGPMSPAETQRRLDKFATSSLVTVPDAGHMVHYDQPDVLATIVRSFVDGNIGR
jgi:pimeloyl-ACP methyl ester carboxylesterase